VTKKAKDTNYAQSRKHHSRNHHDKENTIYDGKSIKETLSPVQTPTRQYKNRKPPIRR